MTDFKRDPDDPRMVLHNLYGEVFRHLRPETPSSAIVYEVDAGAPDAPNVIFWAAEVSPAGKIKGDSIQVVVAKSWLREWFEEKGAACASDLEP